jgi:hypothetical protein
MGLPAGQVSVGKKGEKAAKAGALHLLCENNKRQEVRTAKGLRFLGGAACGL